MGCHRCGYDIMEVKNDKLICSECSHIQEIVKVKSVEEQLYDALEEIQRLKAELAFYKEVPY